MKTKKILLAVVVLLVIIFITSSNKKVDSDIVKIGALIPKTGSAALIGENMRQGLLQAESEINTDGKIIQLIIEDNKNEPAAAVSAVKKLIEVDKVDIIISSMSGATNAIVPIAKEANIPLIATAVYANIPAQYENSLQFHTTPESEVKALIEYLDKVKSKKLGILYSNNDYGISFKDEISKNIKNDVVYEGYSMAENTYKTQILKLVSSGIDTVYVVIYPHNVGVVVKELRELKFSGNIIANTPVYLNGLIEKDLSLSGIYTSVPKNYLDSAQVKYFTENFKQKYPSGNVYITYDILKMVGKELSSGVKVDNIVDSISNKKEIETKVNGKITIDSDTKIANFPLVMVKLEDGNIVEVK